MNTHLCLEYAHADPLPEGEHEFRTPNALVEHFLEAYTEPSDAVVDVFAGYGTTLSVAERLDREAYGVEYEPDRVEYVRDRVSEPSHVRRGDVLDLELSWIPPCECCFTSPPFMERTDDRNPFENYTGESSYDAYLADVERAFGRVESVLAPGGHVVVDVANMKHESRVTTLAWDVADRVSNVLSFRGEVVVGWDDAENPDGDQFGYGYDHSYCLVFENPTD